jgi:hypothetical protein
MGLLVCLMNGYVLFKDNDAFEKARDLIEHRIGSCPSTQSVAIQSIADQLEEFASLAERGLLTEDEFEEQKRILFARDRPPASEPVIEAPSSEASRPGLQPVAWRPTAAQGDVAWPTALTPQTIRYGLSAGVIHLTLVGVCSIIPLAFLRRKGDTLDHRTGSRIDFATRFADHSLIGADRQSWGRRRPAWSG